MLLADNLVSGSTKSNRQRAYSCEPDVIASSHPPIVPLYTSRQRWLQHDGSLSRHQSRLLHAEPRILFVGDTISSINPMEQSRYDNQDVHRRSTIILAMEARRARHPGGSRRRACKEPERPLRPRQHQPSMYSPTATFALPWVRRGTFGTLSYLSVLLVLLWAVPTSAVFIDFQNCLSLSVQNNTPLQLQFVPLFMDAKFNTTDPSNNLQVTVWGNVTGSGPEELVILPPPNNTAYWNSNQTNLGGKIQDEPEPDVPNPRLTTLLNKVDVLTYQPWSQSVDFCDQLINASCPLAPRFYANRSDPYTICLVTFR